MATSSIFHNIRITDPEEARCFLAACEASEQNQSWRRPGRPVTTVNTDRERTRAVQELMNELAEGRRSGEEGGWLSPEDVRAHFYERAHKG